MKTPERHETSWLAVALILMGLQTGCIQIGNSSTPVPPPDSGGPQVEPAYFIHRFQLVWSGSDLASLTQLTVDYPSDIEILNGGKTDSLSLMVEMDVQKVNHNALAAAYLQQIADHSTFNGDQPNLVVPVPAPACAESSWQSGRIQGICLRRLTLFVPATKWLDLDLRWLGGLVITSIHSPQISLHTPASGSATLRNLTASLRLSGGGPEFSLDLDHLISQSASPSEPGASGSFFAELDSISEFTLAHIDGSVHIGLTNPNQATVSLDGSRITHFPYDR